MADRAQLKRIATVRRLRETREKLVAKELAAAAALVAEAEEFLASLVEETERVRLDYVRAMERGITGEEVGRYHFAWLGLRVKRRVVEEELARRRERLAEVTERFRAARIERKQMETWEGKVATALRVEEDRKAATQADELSVIRHSRRQA